MAGDAITLTYSSSNNTITFNCESDEPMPLEDYSGIGLFPLPMLNAVSCCTVKEATVLKVCLPLTSGLSVCFRTYKEAADIPDGEFGVTEVFGNSLLSYTDELERCEYVASLIRTKSGW